MHIPVSPKYSNPTLYLRYTIDVRRPNYRKIMWEREQTKAKTMIVMECFNIKTDVVFFYFLPLKSLCKLHQRCSVSSVSLQIVSSQFNLNFGPTEWCLGLYLETILVSISIINSFLNYSLFLFLTTICVDMCILGGQVTHT